MEGRRDDRRSPTLVTRAHRQAIVRRLPLFTLCWLGTTAAWDVVLVLQSRLSVGSAVVLFGVRLAVLLGAIALCRTRPEAPWVVGAVMTLCIGLGALSTAVFAAVHGKGDVLAFLLLTLYLASSLCFVWGWLPASIVLVGTVVPWLLALPSLSFSIPAIELVTAMLLGTALSLSIAEGAARTFRAAARNRARQEQSREELRASRDAFRDLAARADAARAEAEAATRAKDVFLAVCSHELRSPLTAIDMWTHVLRREGLSQAKFARALDAISNSATMQSRLIDDLLDVSSIASGKLRLSCEALDLVASVQAAVDVVRDAAEQKQIHLGTRLDCGPLVVWGDRARLQQIVSNLLSNAIKFTPEAGRVTLCLDATDGQARLTLEDTGEGIAPEFLPHVFERFSQADPSSTRRHGGLGLGLAIVRELVSAHGGTIDVHSAGRDCGASFVVTLPLRPAVDDASAVQHVTAPPGPVLRGVDVLVVEDDRHAREAIATVLEHSGAQVQAVESADAALAVLEHTRADILLTDLAMPKTDGYQLVEQLRRRGIGIPAAALTAFAGDESRQRAFAIGFGAYLAKPVNPSELVAALATLVHA